MVDADNSFVRIVAVPTRGSAPLATVCRDAIIKIRDQPTAIGDDDWRFIRQLEVVRCQLRF
jgi:hypothetical protein